MLNWLFQVSTCPTSFALPSCCFSRTTSLLFESSFWKTPLFKRRFYLLWSFRSECFLTHNFHFLLPLLVKLLAPPGLCSIFSYYLFWRNSLHPEGCVTNFLMSVPFRLIQVGNGFSSLVCFNDSITRSAFSVFLSWFPATSDAQLAFQVSTCSTSFVFPPCISFSIFLCPCFNT